MKSLRQRWFRFRNIPTIVTWHPAYLLRNPAAKKDTWDDVKLLMAEMGLKPPGKV
jgi:DNA polymerase